QVDVVAAGGGSNAAADPLGTTDDGVGVVVVVVVVVVLTDGRGTDAPCTSTGRYGFGTLMPARESTLDTARWAGAGRAPAPASPPVRPSTAITTAPTSRGPDVRWDRPGGATATTGTGGTVGRGIFRTGFVTSTSTSTSPALA